MFMTNYNFESMLSISWETNDACYCHTSCLKQTTGVLLLIRNLKAAITVRTQGHHLENSLNSLNNVLCFG